MATTHHRKLQKANYDRKTNHNQVITCISQTLTVSSADAVTKHPGTWLLRASPISINKHVEKSKMVFLYSRKEVQNASGNAPQAAALNVSDVT